jgi:hypothetical protein
MLGKSRRMARGLYINSRSVTYRTFIAFGRSTMQIQVNTDRHIDSNDELITQVEATLGRCRSVLCATRQSL